MQLLLVNFVCLISRAKVQHMFFLFTWADTVSQTDLKKILCRRQITSSFEELFHSLFHKNPVPGEMNYFTFFATKSRARGHWLFHSLFHKNPVPGEKNYFKLFQENPVPGEMNYFKVFMKYPVPRDMNYFQTIQIGSRWYLIPNGPPRKFTGGGGISNTEPG